MVSPCILLQINKIINKKEEEPKKSKKNRVLILNKPNNEKKENNVGKVLNDKNQELTKNKNVNILCEKFILHLKTSEIKYKNPSRKYCDDYCKNWLRPFEVLLTERKYSKNQVNKVIEFLKWDKADKQKSNSNWKGWHYQITCPKGLVIKFDKIFNQMNNNNLFNTIYRNQENIDSTEDEMGEYRPPEPIGGETAF